MSETPSTPVPGSADRSATDDDAMWAGRVDFPRGPGDLRSVTTCPACHAPLRSAVCTVCSLDLRHPDAAELAALSAQTADLLDARRALIGRLRRDAHVASRARAAESLAVPAPTAAAHAAAPVAAPVTAPALPTAGAPAAVGDSPAGPPPASTIPPRSAPAAAAPRRSGRSGIQVALLVVGISLLSIFAIFWLAYAFLVYGSTVRMLIIAAGTLATLAAAAALSRRGLTATAEGIAVLGTIILVLDAWALRANDPGGIGAVEAPLYWGVALLVIAVVAVAWSRLGALASPAVGAALILPIGAALVAGHIADAARLEVDAVAVVAGLAAVLAALAHPVMAPPERPRTATVVALSVLAAGAPGAVLALAAGIGGSLGENGVGPLPLLTGAALALVAGAHAIGAARLPGPPVIGVAVAGTAAAGGTLALLAGAASTIVQSDPGPTTAAVSLLVVVALAVALSLIPARAGRARDVARLGALLAAATVAGAAATVALLSAVRPLLEAAENVITELDGPGSIVQIATESDLAALGGTAATLALIALGGRLGGPLRPLVPFTAPALALLVVAAVPLAGAWWLVLALAAVLAIGAAFAVAPARAIEPGASRSAALVALGILAVGGSLTALVVAPRLDSAWILGTATALIAIALGRRATPPGAATVGALGVAVVLVLAAAPALADDLARARIGATDAGVLLALAALVIVGAVLGRLDDAERKAAALLGAVGGIGGALLLADADADARVAVTDGLAALLAIAAVALVVLRTRLVELRRPAAALLGPAVVLLVIVGLRGIAASAGFDTVAGVRLWGPIAALAALLLVAALALATLGRASRADGRPGEHRMTRGAIDAGALAIGLGMLGLALDRDSAVLGLLLSAVLVLIVALSGDGLIGSTSRRRHLGWIALALGTASLWTGLAEEDAADPEGYALPLAGALLLIAAALARRDADSGAPSRSTAPLIGAALAIALLPVGLLSGIAPGAPTIRSAVVALVALALLAAAVARTERLERSIPTLPLVLAGVSVTALGVVGGVLTADLVATPAAPLDEQLRGLLVVVVLAGAAAAVRVGTSGALRDPVAGVLLGLAGLVAAALGLAGVVAPVELVALPVALAALAIGVLELDRRPATSSWPLLALGILLLLGPSLIAIADEPEPWRIVALGVVSAGVMLGGLQQRLQAPFVLGGSVLLVHALVQSWPLLSRAAAAVDWWIWLGIVGILVVAVAARYERRVQNLTAVARRIADLR
ncbi:SCO7613 C-terminal domain-containing membrane protein [Microcella flavibacter]|uniref:SCO7613 C-terminal domain-containing membrane protein n=1 Tax=Microcella flavibacter TaxID=1804990 RepID=UPI0014565521|nr:hypothetical protein [Microcella flavibacter]